MISGDDFAPIFRIEATGYLGRANEIAEEHCQMATLTTGVSARKIAGIDECSRVGNYGGSAIAAESERRCVGSTTSWAFCGRRADPHPPQKLFPDGFSVAHFEQRISAFPCMTIKVRRMLDQDHG